MGKDSSRPIIKLFKTFSDIWQFEIGIILPLQYLFDLGQLLRHLPALGGQTKLDHAKGFAMLLALIISI